MVATERFRRQRATLEAMFEALPGRGTSLPEIRKILARRSQSFEKSAAKLQAMVSRGMPAVELERLVRSYAHMHVNRLMRSSGRQHELVFYDFLCRIYATAKARAKPAEAAVVSATPA